MFSPTNLPALVRNNFDHISKTSVDGEAAPVSFPLDLVDLETLVCFTY